MGGPGELLRRRENQGWAPQYAVVKLAKGVREAAETVCGLLDEAVEAYESGDIEAVIEALDSAASTESEHGDNPATEALRKALLVEEAAE